MRGSTSVLERGDLIVQRLPFRAEDVRACNDHVNLVRAGFHRAANFRDALFKRRKTGGEPRGHCCHMNAAASTGAPRGFDEGMINAHGCDVDVETLSSKLP